MKAVLLILTLFVCVQVISTIPWFYVRHNRWGHHLNHSTIIPHPKNSHNARQQQMILRHNSNNSVRGHFKHQRVAEKSNHSTPLLKSIRLQKGISTSRLNDSIPHRSIAPHRRNDRRRLVHRNRNSVSQGSRLAQDQRNYTKTNPKINQSTSSKRSPSNRQRNHRRRLRNRHHSTKHRMNNSLPSQRDQKQGGARHGQMPSKAHSAVFENHKKHRNRPLSHLLQSRIPGRQHRWRTVRIVNGSSPQQRRPRIYGHNESHNMTGDGLPIMHRDHIKMATGGKSNYTFHRKRIVSNQLDQAIPNLDHIGQLQLHKDQGSHQRIHKRSVANNDTYAEILKTLVFLDDQPNSDRHSQF